MNSRSQRDSFATRLLAGDLDPDSEEARSVLRTDPDLARELRELRALSRRLDAVGRLRRSVELGSSAESVSADVGRTLLGAAHARSTAPVLVGPWARHRWTAAAAVALAIASTWLVLRRGTGAATPAETVVEAALQALHPVGDVADYAPLEWTPAGAADGWYLVRVFGADDPPGSDPIAASRRLAEPRWSPVTDAWPDAIRWEVDAHGPRGHHLGTCRARATRIEGALR